MLLAPGNRTCLLPVTGFDVGHLWVPSRTLVSHDYHGNRGEIANIPDLLVGVRGFEPPALGSQNRCATRLRYTPIVGRKHIDSMYENQLFTAGECWHSLSPATRDNFLCVLSISLLSSHFPIVIASAATCPP
jgi:hypothetical protein